MALAYKIIANEDSEMKKKEFYRRFAAKVKHITAGKPEAMAVGNRLTIYDDRIMKRFQQCCSCCMFFWNGAVVIVTPRFTSEVNMLSTLKRMFTQSLKKRPLITNVAVYATFYTAAEFTQQTFNKMYMPDKPDYKPASGARIVAVGSTLYAPTLYYWFRFLDKKFVGTSVKTVLTKVACDQFLMTPILLASFFIILSVLEGKQDIFEELREKYKMAFLANQTFWIPVQTMNFFFIPPHLRVTYVASASFLWINVLCYIKRQQLASGKKD